MAELYALNFIYFLFLLLANSFADSDSTKAYIEFSMDQEIICNPIYPIIKVEAIDLKKYKDSAVIIKPGHVFDTWRVKYNKHCKFKVKAAKGEGIFAVIQKMSFRTNGSECVDFVKFASENNDESEKYCGKVDKYDKYNSMNAYVSMIGGNEYEKQNSDYHNAEYPIGMFEKFSSQGKITTEIYISQKPLLPGETLDLEVIYTPYKDCRKVENRTGLYWSGPPYSITCINSKFVCDGYINCHSLVCSDESNCTSVNKIISDGVGTKVTVSAVTTIFLCFIIFVLCLWICRKHKKLCWSPDCAGPSNTVISSTSGLPMERGEQNASNPPYVSSAPMLEVAVPGSLHDKDLPPSYDSLFPSQTNTANT